MRQVRHFVFEKGGCVFVPHGVLSSMKDYFDLYYFANKFNFNGATLTEAQGTTFQNRNRHYAVEQFKQLMAFGSDGEIQKSGGQLEKRLI